MMNELVSIIIPVYNVEEYLENCVHSASRQTYQNIEILLVDDGSTDKSGAMCDKLSTEDTRIRVFHKKNGGVSSARNFGVANSKGKWITFLDSDDFIDSSFVEHLFELATEYSADIAQCKMINTYNQVVDFRYSSVAFAMSHDVAINSLFSGADLSCPVPNLFKKTLLETFPFPTNREYGEDVITMCKVFYSAETIVVSDSALYAYLQRPKSAMAFIRDGSPSEQLISCYKERAEWFEEKNESRLARWGWTTYASNVLQYSTTLRSQYGCFDQELIQLIKTRKTFAILPFSLKMKILQYLLCPTMYIKFKERKNGVRDRT